MLGTQYFGLVLGFSITQMIPECSTAACHCRLKRRGQKQSRKLASLGCDSQWDFNFKHPKSSLFPPQRRRKAELLIRLCFREFCASTTGIAVLYVPFNIFIMFFGSFFRFLLRVTCSCRTCFCVIQQIKISK